MGHVLRYIDGWKTDDLQMVQDACADDFVYADPYDGRFSKADFPKYWETQEGEGGFIKTLVQEDGGRETGLAWWRWIPAGHPPEDEMEGAIFMEGDAEGLHSARVAYYRR